MRLLSWVEADRFTAYCGLRGEAQDFRVHRILDCQLAAGLAGALARGKVAGGGAWEEEE